MGLIRILMKIKILFFQLGLLCMSYYFISAQNAPISAIGTVETYNDTAIVSITVTNFSNIGGCDLLFNYDPTFAVATSVTLGPGIGQFFFGSDIGTPGIISVTWVFYQPGNPGLSLPDNSVFLNITFERANYGYSAIEFDHSLPDNCLWADGDFDELNDIPYSTYYINGSIAFEMIYAPITSAPSIEGCQGLTSLDIPVTVSEFYQIGAFNLTLQYDDQVFSYQSFINNSGFPGLVVFGTNPGEIHINGLSDEPGGVTLQNNSVLFTVQFFNLGGSSAINWLDNGESCEYKGPAPDYELRNDIPQSFFYLNGSFTELPFPAEAGVITGPAEGSVCQGENGVVFSIAPIPYANSYQWTLPEGATIESGEGTHEIIVSFSGNAVSGDVSVYGINECGNGLSSPAFSVIVEMAPSIIIQPVSPDTVYAGAGIASFSVTASGTDLTYQWQEYTDDWADITDAGVYSGSATSILTITNPPVSMNNNFYRSIVSGYCEPPAISDGFAKLSVVIFTGFDTNNSGVNHGYDCLEFKSFPNPFSEKISFTYLPPSKGTVTIVIANIYGEKVAILTKKIATIEDNLLTAHTKQLKPGIYIATITFKNEKTIITNTLKIIAKSD